jgi:N utilization substance protein A
MTALNIASEEVLQYVENLAIEKNIQKDLVFQALEDSFNDAVKKKFGSEYELISSVNKKTGVISIKKRLEVVALGDVKNIYRQIDINQAKKIDKSCEVGSFIDSDFSKLEFSYDVISSVKSNLLKRILQIVRQNEYEEFSELVGSFVSGVVKRIVPSGLIVVLGKTECFISKRDLLPQENSLYKLNDKLLLCIKDVKRLESGPQVFGTRTTEEFLIKLFTNLIPEIESGLIDIKAVARDAGSKSIVAVVSKDRMQDAVPICIGSRGKKIMQITKELQNERVDVVEWSQEEDVLIANCLKSIPIDSINRISGDEIEVVVPSEFISAVIGRRGQNANLISKILGSNIKFITKEDKTIERNKIFDLKTSLVSTIVGLDDVVAKILITNGFDTIKKISQADEKDLSILPNFNLDVANQIKSRCCNIIESLESDEFTKSLSNNQFPVELIYQMLATEISNDVALASLSIFDFIETIGEDYIYTYIPNRSVANEQISSIIMQKRQAIGLL